MEEFEGVGCLYVPFWWLFHVVRFLVLLVLLILRIPFITAKYLLQPSHLRKPPWHGFRWKTERGRGHLVAASVVTIVLIVSFSINVMLVMGESLETIEEYSESRVAWVAAGQLSALLAAGTYLVWAIQRFRRMLNRYFRVRF
ncbi:MAG: hypothetical protein H8E48_14075 [Chloroflexi bacterium]|nr:hypothetical protein [Chloroflexota bacterium]